MGGHNLRAIEKFLQKLGGPWHICPRCHWAGYTFNDLDKAVAAIARANKKGDVYFLANNPKGGRLSGKSRKKSDIETVNAVFLDIDDTDPNLVKELADRLDWRPVYIAFTGGGYQAMWSLSEPISPRAGEAIGRWLQGEFEDLQPDATHSCDHIFRLPGTRNRKTGRQNRLCELVFEDWSSRLPIAEAGRTWINENVGQAPPEIAGDFDISHVEPWEILPAEAVRLLSNDQDATGIPYPSRSEHEWAFVGACRRGGVAPHVILAYLAAPTDINEVHRVSHRTHWAKVSGEFIRRSNPLEHAKDLINTYIKKRNAHDQK